MASIVDMNGKFLLLSVKVSVDGAGWFHSDEQFLYWPRLSTTFWFGPGTYRESKG